MYCYVCADDGRVLDEHTQDTELDCVSIDEANALALELRAYGIETTIVVIS